MENEMNLGFLPLISALLQTHLCLSRQGRLLSLQVASLHSACSSKDLEHPAANDTNKTTALCSLPSLEVENQAHTPL